MTISRNEWQSVIDQTTMQIDKMTISLEIQKNVLKFAQERIEKYPKEKPIVEPQGIIKSDKDVGIIK